ncbi:MAG: hypothetical protein ACHQT8_04025 [Chlamydiales bacterium]
MSLQALSNTVAPRAPQAVQDTYLQICTVAFYQTAETVYNYVTQILKLFYVLGYMVYRANWEGRQLHTEEWSRDSRADRNFSRAIRRSLQDPVPEIIPVQGADARLNLNHLQAPIGEERVIPVAPAIDVTILNRLFDELVNVTDPQNPRYIHPSVFTSDPDAPGTYAQTREGLRHFIAFIMNERPDYNRELPNMLRHITFELANGNHPLQTKQECILDLARAGLRHCPTLMNGRTILWYGILKGEERVKTYPEIVHTLLHDFRRDILFYRMARGDVHANMEYLVSIGTHLGIKYAASADNDDPYLMIQLAPRYSLPAFFRHYTPEAIVNFTMLAFNGAPPRYTGRKVAMQLTTDWLAEHLPGRDPQGLFEENGNITREGVILVLKGLGILTPDASVG